jgi:excinuclease UvrABC helicase subunit UvrB
MGNPAAFYDNVIALTKGQTLDRNMLLRRLNDSLYTRNDVSLSRSFDSQAVQLTINVTRVDRTDDALEEV